MPIISGHFIERFLDQKFIIHDIKREIALVYNRDISELIYLSKDKYRRLLTYSNDKFELLWKTFYTSSNIKERQNSKLQKMHMPTRYWHNLTEIK